MKQNTFPSRSAIPTIWLLNTAIVLLWSLTGTTRVAAQELFALSTDKGMELYVVDGQLYISPLVGNRTHGAPHLGYGNGSLPYYKPSLLFQSLSLQIPTFHDKRLTLLDPGFSTSLTGRVITIAGRIEWTGLRHNVQIAEGHSPIERINKDYSLASSRLSPLATGHPDSRTTQ